MARQTRSAARRVSPATASTATPSTVTTGSPMFSAKNSELSLTPATSGDEGGEKPQVSTKTSRRRSVRASSGAVKRRWEDEGDTGALPPAKRRGPGVKVEDRAYVEIVSTTNAFRTPEKETSTGTGRRRSSRISAPPPQTPLGEDSDMDEAVSDDELNFDDPMAVDESENSGSDFQASEDEDFEDKPAKARRSPRKRKLAVSEADFVDDDEDIDEIMLSAAVKLSRQTTSVVTDESGAGPSTPHRGQSAASALRAAAAERRLSKSKDNDDDDVYELPEDYSELSDILSSEDEPLQKGKGKAKAESRESKVVTISDLRERRRQGRRSRRENYSEEQKLIRELGRKLTYAERSTIALYKHHPDLRDVWGDLESKVKVVVPEKAEQPAELKLKLLPFQLESLFWMRKQEQGVWKGGMLADEMGMGKTIQTLALLVSDRRCPNLVVAPTVAIMQWKHEIEAHTEGFKVCIWHGASRENSLAELQKFDVVLTTYAVLESAFRKQHSGFKRKGKIIKEKSPVHQMHWSRVILDEAHNIKERATNTAKAAFALKSDYKWCLSGTPLQNRVGELYSLVRFLGGDPFSFYFCKKCPCKSLHWRFADKRTCDDCGHTPMQHTCFWNNEILTPIQKHALVGPGAIAFKKLRLLLDRMMLRRTKLERADDLGLPPRTVIVRSDYFSPEEKELYLSLFSDAKRQFSYYVDQGTLLNNYSNVFSLITRMRQMACHPDLVLRSKVNANKFSGDVDLGEATVCRLCNDVAEDAIQSKCRHIFDRECIKQYINTAVESTPSCPVCFLPLTIDLEAPALEIDEEKVKKTRQGILGRLDVDKWRSSSKIEALVEELTNLRRQDATTKSLVFSQFVNFLDLIAFRLKRAGFNICRLEGTMTPQARDATIKHFMNNVHVTVFLVSLKAGGVALNLTEASRVYLMDSWWNPAVEFQAMDRIHRLGQHRPVQAIKLITEDSIESRIVQLQEKKSAMINATLSTDDQAMGRLTPDDLSFLFRL